MDDTNAFISKTAKDTKKMVLPTRKKKILSFRLTFGGKKLFPYSFER